MFYYKNKVKPIVILCLVILCLVILALTVSFTVCLWDDTSLKSLSAESSTGNFIGELFPLGGRSMSISGVTYTVVNKSEVGGIKFVTLLSDEIVSLRGNWLTNSDRHDDTSSAYDNSGANGIKERITNYYNSSVNGKEIKVVGNKIGVINDETHKIVGHLGGGWALWAPSEHEMYGSKSSGDKSLDGNQPQMKWIIDNGNIGQVDAPGSRVNAYQYWLRSPVSGNRHNVCGVSYEGTLNHYVTYYINSIRVALNLAI